MYGRSTTACCRLHALRFDADFAISPGRDVPASDSTRSDLVFADVDDPRRRRICYTSTGAVQPADAHQLSSAGEENHAPTRGAITRLLEAGSCQRAADTDRNRIAPAESSRARVDLQQSAPPGPCRGPLVIRRVRPLSFRRRSRPRRKLDALCTCQEDERRPPPRWCSAPEHRRDAWISPAAGVDVLVLLDRCPGIGGLLAVFRKNERFHIDAEVAD